MGQNLLLLRPGNSVSQRHVRTGNKRCGCRTSACRTSQSSTIVFSPSSSMLMTARRERPIRRNLVVRRPRSPSATREKNGCWWRAAASRTRRSPAPASPPEPARHTLGEGCGAQHAGVAELDEGGTLNVAGPAAGNGDGAQFVEGAAVFAGCSHGFSLNLSAESVSVC